MTQVVIPIIPQVEHIELRYVLRSLEKFLIEPFEVTVIGSVLPEWITGVTHIQLPDVVSRKQLSIKRKIIAALYLYEEIFYLADDVFLLKHCVAEKFPYIYDGDLVKRNLEGSAGRLKTRLIELGKGYKNFDCHYPIRYRRDFLKVMDMFDWDMIIKSAYCNYLGVQAIELRDPKVLTGVQEANLEKHCAGLPAFSSGDTTLKVCVPFLNKLMPDKSKFELYE